MKNLLNTLNKAVTTQIDLNLKNTLHNGQAFNWEDKSDDRYVGVVGNMLLRMEYNENLEIQYQLLNEVTRVEYAPLQPKSKTIEQQVVEVLNVYLRLDHDLPTLITQWRKDAYFNDVGTRIQGLRMLKQEPFECLVSFMVSQNNNIKRIATILLAIRRAFGTLLGSYESVNYYRFPSLIQLKQVTEVQLREMGLGYRANYIVQLVKTLEELGYKFNYDQSGEQYLLDLLGKEDDLILEKLLQFKGVGKKVADCVRLFSMECNGVVPVDTHVFQIYMNKYKKGSKKKVDAGCYDEVQNLFKSIFGDYAGWAHSYLFAAELPQFKVPITKQSKQKVNKLAEVVATLDVNTEVKIKKKIKQVK